MTVTKQALAALSREEKRRLLARVLERRSQSGDGGAPAGGGIGGAAEAPQLHLDPANRHEPFPLNDLQQAYLFGRGEDVELGDNSIHVYMEIVCPDIDLGRLAEAFRRLIERHDMLRSVILPDGRQTVLERVESYEIAVRDLSASTEAAAEEVREALREELSHQVFETDRWPCFDLRACRLPDGSTTLHLSLDLIRFDAPSFLILFDDWGRFYRGEAQELAPLEATFRDYVIAERGLADSESTRQDREYWLSRLPSLPPAPRLPLARDPGTVRRGRFLRRTGRLDAEAWKALQERGRAAGITSPSTLLCAVFAEILGAWSGNRRFCLNLSANRRRPLHPQVSQIVGNFSELVLLEVDPGAAPTFEERALRLQEQLWRDLDHQDFGGVRLLREIARRDRGLGARMPVVFTALLLDLSRFAWLGEVHSFVTQTPQVWLDHQISEVEGALEYHWDAIEEIFPAGMLDDMLASYGQLLESLAHQPEAWTRPRGGLLPPRQELTRRRVNATDAPVPGGLLHDGFRQQARRRPHARAISSDSRDLTYGELAASVGDLARRLREHGARPNRLVAVVMEKGWEQVAAGLAVVESGAAYLPIDARWPDERIRLLLDRGDVEILVTQERVDLRTDWPTDRDLVRLRVAEPPSVGHDSVPAALAPVQTPEDLAYVIFTSGSTGEPKGVMIDHRGALNTIADVNRRFSVGPEDRVLALSSLSFDLSVYDVFGVLAAGGTVVLPEAEAWRDPGRWAELLGSEGVTVWNSVPALMEMLVEHAENRPVDGSSLRLVMLSGDWIPLGLPDRIRALAPDARVFSLGGATEASIWSILFPVEEVDPAWTSVPYGRPMDNQRFHVLDELLEPCPVHVPGELYIGGIGLARGYWKDPETTERSFFSHPRTGERLYRTGDLGRYRVDGTIEFLGRRDFQVKIQGHRVELGEIEACLGRHPAVREAAVVALGDPRGQRRLVGYVVPTGGEADPPEQEALREHLAAELPPYMVPSSFVRLDRMPLTANGKVDRSALPEPAARPAASAPAPAVSGDGILERVRQIVARILDADRLSADADLLDAGATSIHMVRIANALESEVGYRPGIEDIFLHSTVRALADQCAGSDGRKDGDVSQPRTGPPTVLDPEARRAFRTSRPGVRRDAPGFGVVALPAGADAETEERARRYAGRRSRRSFLDRPVPLERLASLLSCLREQDGDGVPGRRLYASGGALYPVQVYVWVRDGGVDGLDGGAYYYHPVDHRLVRLAPGVEIPPALHFAPNRAMFRASAFSLYLVAELDAVTPLYGERALPFATLEAGAMAHLLMTEAPEEVGLCPVGGVEVGPLREALGLADSQVLVHSLVGGIFDAARADEPVDVERPLETVAEAGGRSRPIPRAPRDRPLPLSFAQQRLWFLHQAVPLRHLYNRTTEIALRGDLDLPVLERCLAEIVRRHEVLRTTFSETGESPSRPVQRIHAPTAPDLPVVDLTALPAPERDRCRQELARAEALVPFDLETGPLLRFLVVRMAPGDHRLAMTVHHIVGDGWSFGVFLRELVALWNAFRAGRPSPLAELAVQYADYAWWQRSADRAAAFDELLEYWRQHLEGAPAVTELPADRPRPPVQSFRGAQRVQVLPASLVGGLERLARGEGATLFMVVLAALETLLFRSTGQRNVVLGTPVANRERSELEPLIGFFVNSLPLRTDLGGDPSFRELVGRVRGTVLGAYAHQDLPFEKLVEELRIERSLGRTPLFQIWFVFQNTPMPASRAAGLEVAYEEIDDGTTKFDLMLLARPVDRDLEITWCYSTDLFDGTSVGRLAGRLETLVADAVRRPDAGIGELEVINESERERDTMESAGRRRFEVSKLKRARRKTLDLGGMELVRRESLGAGGDLPLVMRPTNADVDLAAWAGSNGAEIEEALGRHGAILFRGFGVSSVSEFERFASGLCGDLYGDYGDLPKEEQGEKVYHSTPYPEDKTILFHNESSHLSRWPTRQFFYCVQPSETGGQTPVVDGRKMLEALPADLVSELERRQLTYVRNFTRGFDVSWEDFFKTDDRDAVERRCREEGVECRWNGDDLQTRQTRPAVVRHPERGERVWFNQLQLHHPACLDPEVRESMMEVFAEDALPRNVVFGDGSPIPDQVMDRISEAYWRTCAEFPWEAGDVLLVDNMLVAHARRPFTGARKIVVAMGRMRGVEDLAS